MVKRLFKKRTWNRSFQEKYEFDLVVCLSPFDESGQRNVVTPLAGVRFLPIKCSWTEHWYYISGGKEEYGAIRNQRRAARQRGCPGYCACGGDSACPQRPPGGSEPLTNRERGWVGTFNRPSYRVRTCV